MRRTVRTSLAVAALMCGTSVAAFAQTVPAAPVAVPAAADAADAPAQPATPTVAQPKTATAPGTVAQAAPRPAPTLAPLSHLPIIDFVATFTQPAYYGLPTQIKGYDPLDLGGTVRIPVTRKFNLLFDRITEGTINQPLECVIQGGTRVCSNDSRDILLQYHGLYTFNRYLSVDLGDSFRHRVWNSGASGVSAVPFPASVSSTEHHFAYLGFNYTTKPWKALLNSTFVFSETLDAQNVDHHVGVLCTAANKALGANCTGLAATQVGYLDERPGQNVYYETTQGVSMIVPVDAKRGATLLLNERWGALNFYENAPFPYRWNSAMTYQLSKRFSPGFTLALRHSDYHAIPQGAPFAFPNAIHVGSWDVIGTFHVDTNTFFAH
ncbi:MAG: hypothetical protein JWO85_2994 [Candidatus Eremiobacteraeota bacterium]|nr:hypothetical protein [Candidatus Eremiobacteraeota bacterium]